MYITLHFVIKTQITHIIRSLYILHMYNVYEHWKRWKVSQLSCNLFVLFVLYRPSIENCSNQLIVTLYTLSGRPDRCTQTTDLDPFRYTHCSSLPLLYVLLIRTYTLNIETGRELWNGPMCTLNITFINSAQ